MQCVIQFIQWGGHFILMASLIITPYCRIKSEINTGSVNCAEGESPCGSGCATTVFRTPIQNLKKWVWCLKFEGGPWF